MRKQAEDIILYNFYLDKMPVNGVPIQSKTMLNHIALKVAAKNDKVNKENPTEIHKRHVVKELIKEAKYEFARCQNKMIFDIVALHGDRVSIPVNFDMLFNENKQATYAGL